MMLGEQPGPSKCLLPSLTYVDGIPFLLRRKSVQVLGVIGEKWRSDYQGEKLPAI